MSDVFNLISLHLMEKVTRFGRILVGILGCGVDQESEWERAKNQILARLKGSVKMSTAVRSTPLHIDQAQTSLVSQTTRISGTWGLPSRAYWGEESQGPAIHSFTCSSFHFR